MSLTDYFTRKNPFTGAAEKFAAVIRSGRASQAVVLDVGGFEADDDHPVPAYIVPSNIEALAAALGGVGGAGLTGAAQPITPEVDGTVDLSDESVGEWLVYTVKDFDDDATAVAITLPYSNAEAATKPGFFVQMDGINASVVSFNVPGGGGLDYPGFPRTAEFASNIVVFQVTPTPYSGAMRWRLTWINRPAPVLVPGVGVDITESPSGTFTITNTNPALP